MKAEIPEISGRSDSKNTVNFDYVRPKQISIFSDGDWSSHMIGCLLYGLCRIGVVSGKAIFGPPLDEYWKKKRQEEASAKENDSSST
ncbi:Transmembrane protein [Senna tora]|uniref:Transmembrane protein n=1 Tax=Senna tora TaxID=362788 RepID=A0A834STC2_9FABA|nr:Transmembrane protein [Senna tora]